MKSNPSEFKDIIRKLLEKTRQRKVEWEQAYSSRFRCSLPAGDDDFFQVTVSFSAGSNFEAEAFALRMLDQGENVIFEARSNDLPTSPEEEEVSQMIEEIYEHARRQALKIEQKLELASSLLDRV